MKTLEEDQDIVLVLFRNEDDPENYYFIHADHIKYSVKMN